MMTTELTPIALSCTTIRYRRRATEGNALSSSTKKNAL